MTDSRFEDGDTLTFRGHEYDVEQVDFTLKGRVIQYRLDPLGDAPPATLEPENGDVEENFAVKEFHQVDVEEIDVDSGGEDGG